MKSILKNPYVSISIFSIAVLLLHYLIDAFTGVVSYYSLVSIYAFHIISALTVTAIIHWVYKSSQDHTGFAFMGTSLLKMLAAIVFLLPSFLADEKPDFGNILNFFIPYFLFLIFEATQVVKLINSKGE
jgi:hypothetical protein